MFPVDGWKVYVIGIVAFLILGSAFVGGYKTGVWKQGALDAKDIQDAKNALTQNAQDVAAAEKAARQEAAKEYEAEIAAAKERAKLSDDIAAQFQKDNATLNSRLFAANKALEAARRDPATKAALDTPIPAAVRDGLRDALRTSDAPASADHRPY